MPFVHLHTHSEYSLLDGANRIPELLDRIQALGMDSLAITDHGNLHGAWSFYDEAKARKIRPILGFEAYLAFGSRHARERPADAPAAYSHLVLLARNRVGYHNLIKLSSIGFLEGYYRRPRIDKDVLAQHREGLVALAACLSGEISLYLRQESYVKSEEEMRALFPDRPDVLAETARVAELCEFDFEKRYFLPQYPRPAEFATDQALLVHLARQGAAERYGDPLPPAVEERLQYELDVIATTGYAGYFLIVYDMIKAARDRGIPVGPGRGSSAGSLVAYALRTTTVDHLRVALLVARFLTPERIP